MRYAVSMNGSDIEVDVLFVCMGNICRSPTGEGVFRRFVADAGYDGVIRIDSAGTTAYHSGESADARMRKAASRRGYRLDSIARQVRVEDIDAFDLIVPMDHDNLADLERMAGGPQPHIRLLGCYLDGGIDNARARPVPDPYFGGPTGFDRVLDMIESACPSLLEHCLALHRSKTP
jgi:protein-tyrosine phosphatase